MSTGSVPSFRRHFGTDLLGILPSYEALFVGAAPVGCALRISHAG